MGISLRQPHCISFFTMMVQGSLAALVPHEISLKLALSVVRAFLSIQNPASYIFKQSDLCRPLNAICKRQAEAEHGWCYSWL